ncbi:SOS response-associated peptidase family protein [Aureibaculum sp. 2210JD6-5]|uniref:SOS response-associated peptidase n=1 Tax=Aureibaculum sp. 2210JD6-5 TaxID=3103957 RepID=UPI002AAD6B71|nr:SOS response-associated peptidase family protein [Aureibaculum sp. 2210JD6-5]MDY7393938.1 SOS response-associated peptidase family protein [Aureibaculum sp. 2210JD6-5]
MFYKISNIANKKIIEEELEIRYKFPEIYKQESVINGLKESNLSVVTQENPDQISYAIWGLLPEEFDDNWSVFQDVTNTLNTDLEQVEDRNELYTKSLAHKRCLIIATGFFTSYLFNGKVFPYYIHLPDEKPFCFAGIYNELDDGFLTCSILISKTVPYLKNIPHISSKLPVILEPKNYKYWLQDNLSLDAIQMMLASQDKMDFEAYPISRNFYKKKFDHHHILQPIKDFSNLN